MFPYLSSSYLFKKRGRKKKTVEPVSDENEWDWAVRVLKAHHNCYTPTRPNKDELKYIESESGFSVTIRPVRVVESGWVLEKV